jgi:hypothetical protein
MMIYKEIMNELNSGKHSERYQKLERLWSYLTVQLQYRDIDRAAGPAAFSQDTELNNSIWIDVNESGIKWYIDDILMREWIGGDKWLRCYMEDMYLRSMSDFEAKYLDIVCINWKDFQ